MDAKFNISVCFDKITVMFGKGNNKNLQRINYSCQAEYVRIQIQAN